MFLGVLVFVPFAKMFAQPAVGSHRPVFPRELIEVQDAGFPSLPPDPGSQVSMAGLRICLSLSFHVLPVLRPWSFTWSFTWSSKALGLSTHLGTTLEFPGGVYKAILMLSLLPGNTDSVFQAPIL